MALSVKKGSFTKTSGAQAIDVGFLPKALILFGHNLLSQGAGTFQEHHGMTVGISDGTTHVCSVAASEDAVASADCYKIWHSVVWATIDPANGTAASTGTVAFSGTSFTITWSAATNNPVIQYIALGGSDLENAKVVLKDIGRTTTGNQAYTGVGFQGNFALFLMSGWLVGTSATAAADATWNIGCAKSSTERWSISITADDGNATADTWRYQRTDRCMTLLVPATGALETEADFVSWDTDGFTLNWTDAPPNSTIDFGALVLKGANLKFNVGNFLQPDATGNQTITLADATLDPDLVFLASVNNTAFSTPQGHSRVSIGATTATDQGYAWAGDQNLADPMICASLDRTDNAIGLHTEAATATSSTTQAQAALGTNGLNTAGQFTLNWGTVADTTDRELLYWTIGMAGGGPPPPPPNIEQSIWIEWEEA